MNSKEKPHENQPQNELQHLSMINEKHKERLDLRGARFDIDLERLLSPNDMIWEKGPPACWCEGAPVANGDFGAVVYGYPECLSFALGKNDVWDRRNDRAFPFAGKSYDEIRKTYFDNDEETYNRLVAEADKQFKKEQPHLTTCGILRFFVEPGYRPHKCRMRVGLRQGECLINYTDRSIRCIASRAHKVFLLEFDQGNAFGDMVKKSNTNIGGDLLDELHWDFQRVPLQDNPPPTFIMKDGTYLVTQNFTAGGRYTVGIRFPDFASAAHNVLPGRLSGRLATPKKRIVNAWLTIVSS
ncbi:MAG: hypothetical protein Q8O19_02060, partial [Rectinemataceae bacterium]|nr:hypothetical protein [Rectinemataceae bacterium]